MTLRGGSLNGGDDDGGEDEGPSMGKLLWKRVRRVVLEEKKEREAANQGNKMDYDMLLRARELKTSIKLAGPTTHSYTSIRSTLQKHKKMRDNHVDFEWWYTINQTSQGGVYVM